MFSASTLSTKHHSAHSQACVYTRCLIYYKLSPTCNNEFSPDNTAAIKLKFTDCGRELLAPLIPRLQVYTLQRAFLRPRVIFPTVKCPGSDIIICLEISTFFSNSTTLLFERFIKLESMLIFSLSLNRSLNHFENRLFMVRFSFYDHLVNI